MVIVRARLLAGEFIGPGGVLVAVLPPRELIDVNQLFASCRGAGLGIEGRFVLVGHSFGSIVVAATLADAGAPDALHPDAVVLVNPIGQPALRGPRGIMTLSGLDSIIRARFSTDSPGGTKGIGNLITGGPLSGVIAESAQGTFARTSEIDGIPRMLSYGRVGSYPLIVTVGLFLLLYGRIVFDLAGDCWTIPSQSQGLLVMPLLASGWCMS